MFLKYIFPTTVVHTYSLWHLFTLIPFLVSGSVCEEWGCGPRKVDPPIVPQLIRGSRHLHLRGSYTSLTPDKQVSDAILSAIQCTCKDHHESLGEPFSAHVRIIMNVWDDQSVHR